MDFAELNSFCVMVWDTGKIVWKRDLMPLNMALDVYKNVQKNYMTDFEAKEWSFSGLFDLSKISEGQLEQEVKRRTIFEEPDGFIKDYVEGIGQTISKGHMKIWFLHSSKVLN